MSDRERQRREAQRRDSVSDRERQRRELRRRAAYAIEEWARQCGVSRSKIYQEIAAGRLKVRKCGARSLVLAEDGEAWLAALPVAVPTP